MIRYLGANILVIVLASFCLGFFVGTGWFTYEPEQSVSDYLQSHGCRPSKEAQ